MSSRSRLKLASVLFSVMWTVAMVWWAAPLNARLAIILVTLGALTPSSFFGEAQVVDFARVSRRSRGRYWVRSGLIPSRAKALVWSGVGRA